VIDRRYPLAEQPRRFAISKPAAPAAGDRHHPVIRFSPVRRRSDLIDRYLCANSRAV
jgi:hypothetical protein